MNLVILFGQHMFKQVQLKIVFDIENYVYEYIALENLDQH